MMLGNIGRTSSSAFSQKLPPVVTSSKGINNPQAFMVSKATFATRATPTLLDLRRTLALPVNGQYKVSMWHTVEHAIKAGGTTIQIQSKGEKVGDVCDLIRTLKIICGDDVHLSIQDRIDIAALHQLKGLVAVHDTDRVSFTADEVKTLLGPDALVGVQINSFRDTEIDGFDYAQFGPTFNGTPISPSDVELIKRKLSNIDSLLIVHPPERKPGDRMIPINEFTKHLTEKDGVALTPSLINSRNPNELKELLEYLTPNS